MTQQLKEHVSDFFLRPTLDRLAEGSAKIAVGWALYLGSMNLHELLQILVLFAGLVFTVSQTFFLWKDRLQKRRKRRQEELDSQMDMEGK